MKFRKETGKNWITNRVVDEQNKLSKYLLKQTRNIVIASSGGKTGTRMGRGECE